ncbi:hypothetical protein E8E11_006984 [Didymella keratinophila]|nr:hypothetical protein E8E11_006984 [Didymella keratinophila]
METRRLHNPDMKQLVQVLRTDPRSTVNPGDERFEKATQAAIKKLPRRLRSSAISWHGSLCRSHKGLDFYLVNDVWSWIKYELEVAIGRFLYPIIMSDALPDVHEFQVRQLEPVVRMFTTEWTLAGSAAPGKHPIDKGNKWAYQDNKCPACMLTRLGSDIEVLVALFACMYGRLQSRSEGHGQNGVKSVRNKRLRFIRYWMKTHSEGDKTAEVAYNFGVHLKAVRRDAKYTLRRSKQATYNTRDSHDQTPTTPHHCLDGQNLAAFDLSEPFHPDDRTINFKRDPKSGLVPLHNPAAPTIIQGWDVNVTLADIPQARTNAQSPTPRIQPPTPRMSIPPMPFTTPTPPQTPAPHRRKSIFSTTSTPRPRPVSSVYSVHTPVQNPPVTTLRSPRPASYAYSLNHLNRSCLTSASSILSYNGPTRSSKPRGFDPLETADEWMDKWTAPKDSMLRDYNFSPTVDDRRNTYMEKYRPPPSPSTKANRREAVLPNGDFRDGDFRDGDFRDGVVQYEGQILPKPSRCSMYSAFGVEGNNREEFEIVDVTPPPSPVAELNEEKEEHEDVEVGGVYEYQSPTPPPPAPWYGNPYGDCAPAPLRPRKHG